MARGGEPVTVLSMNPYLDLDGDYRLAFLRELPGVVLDHLYRFAQPDLLHKAAGAALAARGAMGRAARALVAERWWEPLRGRGFFGAGWATRVLRKVDARLLVFDWVKPGQHVTRELLEAARTLGIRTVSLPHGVSITTGDLRTRAAARAGELPDYDRAFPFDAFVAPHHDHAAYFERGGMPRERLHVLGSARFCDEWVRKSEQIAPRAGAQLGPDDGRLKVVFFDKDSYSLDQAKADASVRAIAARRDVRFVVKPQTRNDATKLGAIEGVEVATETPSVSLVAWSDVVVGTISSVLIEPLCQDKTLIYPSHHVTLRTRLEETGAATSVASDDELSAALDAESSRRGSARAPAASVRACLDEIVYADSPDHDVLGRYLTFLNQCRLIPQN